MDGFYEWRKAEDGSRQAYAVALATGAPMAVAGLWEGWKSPEGEWLRTFTVITTRSTGKQALVHHRMPVILGRDAWDAWLSAAPTQDALALLVPCPADDLAIWPVDNRVGRVAENDAGLLKRDPLAAVPEELNDPSPALGREREGPARSAGG
jgi:putative SOS response-associated peptidase YedK